MVRPQLLGVVFVLFMATQSASGQSAPGAHAEDAEAEEIEEITVYGQKPLLGLRWQMQRAEKTFYDVFNELNSNDDFDVKCEHKTQTGSRLTEYACTPRFVRVHQSQLNKQRLYGGLYIPEKKMDIAGKQGQMREELVALIETHPELLKAFTDALDAKKEYQAERQVRCTDGSILCNGE